MKNNRLNFLTVIGMILFCVSLLVKHIFVALDTNIVSFTTGLGVALTLVGILIKPLCLNKFKK